MSWRASPSTVHLRSSAAWRHARSDAHAPKLSTHHASIRRMKARAKFKEGVLEAPRRCGKPGLDRRRQLTDYSALHHMDAGESWVPSCRSRRRRLTGRVHSPPTASVAPPMVSKTTVSTVAASSRTRSQTASSTWVSWLSCSSASDYSSVGASRHVPCQLSCSSDGVAPM
jgi:hypothetical protein